MTKPLAVIFDWDNTLVETGEAIAVALNEARKAFGLPAWSVEEVRRSSSRALRESFPEWFGDRWEDARKIFYDCYEQNHCAYVRKANGAQALLEKIKAAGIKIYLVSNKRGDLLRAEVNSLGWSDCFTRVVGSLDAVKDKPSAAVVDAALRDDFAYEDRSRIWLIGDAISDIETARNAGCVPVLVRDKDLAKKESVSLYFSDCQEAADKLILIP